MGVAVKSSTGNPCDGTILFHLVERESTQTQMSIYETGEV